MLLATAQDWQLKVDIGRQLKFPENIALTTLRPDIVLVSETTRQVVLLELIVAWEDQMEEAFDRRAKYDEVADVCRSTGWRTRCNPIEVGCREFVGQSFIRALKMLEARGLQNRKATRDITNVAERAPRWLSIKQGDPWAQAT